MEHERKLLLDELKNNKNFLPPFSGDPVSGKSKDFFYSLYNINVNQENS